jgi:antitoxin component of RelBE/YafQ-DinJ toxin-antitoxin module
MLLTCTAVSMEEKPARLTLLIDPSTKQALERLCEAQDVTASQVVRMLIREWLASHGARPAAKALPRRKPR